MYPKAGVIPNIASAQFKAFAPLCIALQSIYFRVVGFPNVLKRNQGAFVRSVRLFVYRCCFWWTNRKSRRIDAFPLNQAVANIFVGIFYAPFYMMFINFKVSFVLYICNKCGYIVPTMIQLAANAFTKLYVT